MLVTKISPEWQITRAGIKLLRGEYSRKGPQNCNRFFSYDVEINGILIY